MKKYLALTALAAFTCASVGCVQPRPDTVIVHETKEKPVYRTITKTETRYVPAPPSGPSATIPGSPQQLGDPNAAGGFRATTP